ncbi:hypothetical protein GCM10020254_66550 [Streptomyces goshikiensis]
MTARWRKRPPAIRAPLEPDGPGDAAAGQPQGDVHADGGGGQAGQDGVRQDEGAQPGPVEEGFALEPAAAQPDGMLDDRVLQVEFPGDPGALDVEPGHPAPYGGGVPAQQQRREHLGAQGAPGLPAGPGRDVLVGAGPEVDPLAEREGVPYAALGRGQVGDLHRRDGVPRVNGLSTPYRKPLLG